MGEVKTMSNPNRLEHNSAGKYYFQLAIRMDKHLLAQNLDRLLFVFEKNLPADIEQYRPDLQEAILTIRTALADMRSGRLIRVPQSKPEKYAELLISDEDADAILKKQERSW